MNYLFLNVVRETSCDLFKRVVLVKISRNKVSRTGDFILFLVLFIYKFY